MSKFCIAHRHASISKHVAHHRVLYYCSLEKPDSHKINSLTSRDYVYGYGIVFVAKNVMAGINV